MSGRTLAQMRQADLQKIHIARKQLSMSDDTYRTLIRNISKGRTDSSGELTHVERAALLAHFKSCGFKARKPRAAQSMRKPDLPIGNDSEQIKKMRSLWISLHRAGEVRDGSELALCRYVKNQTAKNGHGGIEHPRFLNVYEASQIIERLKNWDARITAARNKRGGENVQATQE